MTKPYDPKAFFTFLGFHAGDMEYNCPDLRTLNVYCRGDREQLQQLLSVTPFTLTSDIFVATIADFANCSTAPYMDAGIILPIAYKEHIAGNYFFEFEDQHWSVAAGRELWGYPKRYAKIALDNDQAGAHGTVQDYDTSIMDIAVSFDDAVTSTPWKDVKLAPTIQIRAVPELDGPSFSQFDLIMRNTAANFVVKERRLGKGKIALGPVDIGSGLLGGAQLKIKEVLGAEYIVGDFAATKTNGTPVTLDSLVGKKS